MKISAHKDPIVEVQDLTVRFDDVLVIENISFAIDRGSFVGLIGPNGAGKSTLLKTLLGLIVPTGGSCRHIAGLKMSYVPQHYVLSSFVPISVSEVVQMGSRVRVKHDMIRDILHEVGLDGSYVRKNYHTLSGGQKQRVMIARTLIDLPDIIFFDEPLSGVDLKTKTQIHGLLKDLNKKGVTIFFVSHDIDHVVDACDLVLCLDGSLHRGCHPVAFANGDRSHKPLLPTDTKCLAADEVKPHKKAVHHHHT